MGKFNLVEELKKTQEELKKNVLPGLLYCKKEPSMCEDCPYKKYGENCIGKMMQEASVYFYVKREMPKLEKETIKPNDSNVASEAGNSGFEDSERGERK